MALDKYIHISAHRPAFHDHVALMGPDPENVAATKDLKHELVRAALLRHGIDTRFEAASIGVIVGGTGLG